MKGKLIRILSALTALTLALGLAACGEAGNTPGENTGGTGTAAADGTKEATGEKVKLRIYTYYDDNAKGGIIPAAEEMKTIMPNVEIEFMPRADADQTKLKSMAAVGDMPEIFESDGSLIETFKKSNQLVVLDKYIEEMNVKEKINESMYPVLWNPDGHCYAMPFDGSNIGLIYYNKDLFSSNSIKVPTNYDEFLAAVKAFSEKGIVPIAFFAKEKWPGVQLYDMLVTRVEPAGVNKVNNGQGKITEEAYKVAAERLYELAKSGMVVKGAFNTDYDQAFAMFQQGKAAMMVNGSWMLGDAAEKIGDHIDYLGYPLADAETVENSKYNMAAGATEGGYSVAASSKDVDLTAKYAIQFAMLVGKYRVVKMGYCTPLLKENPEPEKPHKPIQEKFIAETPSWKTMTVFPFALSNLEFKTALEENVEKLMLGSPQFTPDDFIKEMEKATSK